MKKTKQKKTKQKKTYLILIIIIFIIIVIAVGAICFKVGFNIGANKYKRIVDYYFVSEEQVSVNGKITEIQEENNLVYVEITVQDPYALPEEWKTKIVKVTVTGETKITIFDFETAKLIETQVAKLKVGDKINVRAKENIKDKTEFTAEYIGVYENPEIPEEILEPIEPE